MEIRIRYYIKAFVRKILNLLKGIFLNILSILSVLVQSDFFCIDLKKIKTKKFDELILIGNGPSFNETFRKNINFFSGKAIACVNDFAISEYFGVIKPDFYIVFDLAYLIKNPSKQIRKTNDQIFQLCKEKVTWPMTIVMPSFAKRWNWFIGLPKLNKNINVCYANLTRVYCSKNLKFFLYSRNLASPRCSNVLVNSTLFAINMGYKKIFLVGADHSWHENIFLGKDNVLYLKRKHFYPEVNQSIQPLFKNPEETQIYKLHEYFRALSIAFEGHQEVSEYAKLAGAKVYNASKKSYIDAYERVTLK